MAEIESFKKTKESYGKILTQTSAHLDRLEELYRQPINVDIAAMKQEHLAIRDTLRKGLYLPRWLLVTILSLFMSLAISLVFNYKHAKLNEAAKDYIDHLEEKIAAQPKSGKRR
ncbi:MAG: hypothetical protein GY874_09915 [Desulfobacteraceae bacterium]|nr:hypothetical protein [Desulfobacteraceae bacterium]